METFNAMTTMWESAVKEVHRRPFTWNFLGEFVADLKTYSVLSMADVYICIAIALALTALRFVLTKSVFEPVAISSRFTLADRPKFSESSWKLMFYVTSVVWQFYIVIFNYPEFMTNGNSHWENWSPEAEVPSDIYYLYVFECGFYLHAVFGTIYMDVWRRDSIAMIAHHILTDTLIIFSLAVRFHRVGLVVLILHDAADVLLEFTKLCTCLKNRTKNPGMLLEGTIAGGFATFALVWLVFRLYAYPKIVLYSCAVLSMAVLPDGPFYFVFNIMLLMLFCLNVYWFHFILLLIIRIATGQSREVEDTREDDINVANSKIQEQPQTNGTHSNGTHTAMANGHASSMNGHKNVKQRLVANGKAHKH